MKKPNAQRESLKRVAETAAISYKLKCDKRREDAIKQLKKETYEQN